MSADDWLNFYTIMAQSPKGKMRLRMVDTVIYDESCHMIRLFATDETGHVALIYEGEPDIVHMKKLIEPSAESIALMEPDYPICILRHERDLTRVINLKTYEKAIEMLMSGSKSQALPFCIQAYKEPYLNMRFLSTFIRDRNGMRVSTYQSKFSESYPGCHFSANISKKRLKDVQGDPLLVKEVEILMNRIVRHFEKSHGFFFFFLTNYHLITGLVCEFIMSTDGELSFIAVHTITWPKKIHSMVEVNGSRPVPLSSTYHVRKEFGNTSAAVPVQEKGTKPGQPPSTSTENMPTSPNRGQPLVPFLTLPIDKRLSGPLTDIKKQYPWIKSSGVNHPLLSPHYNPSNLLNSGQVKSLVDRDNAILAMEHQIARNKHHIKTLKDQIDAQKASLVYHDSKVTDLEEKRQQDAEILKGLLRDRDMFTSQLATSYNYLKNEVNDKERMISQNEETQETIMKTLDEKQANGTKVESELMALKEDLEKLTTKFNQSKSQRSMYTTQVEDLNSQIVATEEQAVELQSSLVVLREQLEVESKLSAGLSKELAKARDQLNRLIQDQLLTQPDASEPIQMDVTDVLSVGSEIGVVMANLGIQDMLTRYRCDLEEIFVFYAEISSVEELDRMDSLTARNYGVDFQHFQQFVHDCQMSVKPLPKTTIESIFSRVAHFPGADQTAEKILSFNNFVECIVRLSHERFPTMKNIAAAVAMLLTTKVVPNASRLRPVGIRHEMEAPEFKTLLSDYKHKLIEIFSSHTDSSTKIGPTMSFSACLVLLGECNLLDNTLTNMRTLKCFQDAHIPVKGHKKSPDDVDLPISFYEWCEFLVRCAHAKLLIKAPLTRKLGMFLDLFLPEATKRIRNGKFVSSSKPTPRK